MDEMVEINDGFKEKARVEQYCCDDHDVGYDKDVEKQIDDVIQKLKRCYSVNVEAMKDEVVKFGHWCSDTAARDKRYELGLTLIKSNKYRDLGRELIREMVKPYNPVSVEECIKRQHYRINLMWDCIKALEDCEKNALRRYVVYDTVSGIFLE